MTPVKKTNLISPNQPGVRKHVTKQVMVEQSVDKYCRVVQSNSARPHMGPREGKGDVAISDFVPFPGTPENAGATFQFRPHMGPREGKGDVAISDFVPFSRDPRERRSYVAIPPTYEPLRRVTFEIALCVFCKIGMYVLNTMLYFAHNIALLCPKKPLLG